MKPAQIALIILIIFIITVALSSAQASSSHKFYPVHQFHSAGGTDLVWVNTRSGIYHLSGERWFHHTEHGVVMTEAQAVAHGYRISENGQ